MRSYTSLHSDFSDPCAPSYPNADVKPNLWVANRTLFSLFIFKLENSREKIKADYERKLVDSKVKLQRELDDVQSKQNKLSETSLEEVKKKLMEEKEADLKSQADKLNAQAKRELVRLTIWPVSRGRGKGSCPKCKLERGANMHMYDPIP